MLCRCKQKERRGAILPLAVLLLLVILAMAAFAVDVGYMVEVQSQLQKAADAAALAGAQQLMQPYVQYNYPGQSPAQKSVILNNAIANAKAAAKQFAALNQAGDVSSVSLNDADIVCGFLDANNNFYPTPPDPRFPNSVQVTARRDNQANGPLRLIFGPLIGTSTSNLTATGRGTMMSNPTSFSSSMGVNGLILPVALEASIWDTFILTGTSPSANNPVQTGPNGKLELQIYPDPTKFGSLGLVAPGPPARSVPAYRNWIDNGPSPSDLQYLTAHNLLPVSPPQPETWSAGPGVKSALTSAFSSIVGEPRLLVLYDGTKPATNGYPVIGFAGVTVSQVNGSGANMSVSVQPTFVMDPTGMGGSPTGTSPIDPTFSFAAPRLTR